MRHFSEEKNPNFFKIGFFPVGGKWFPSLIEHERHPLGVSKLFSELFIKPSWHILEAVRFLSLRYSTDFRCSRLVVLALIEMRLGIHEAVDSL